MNYKIRKLEAIFLILIIMINKLLLDMPKDIIEHTKTGAPINIIFTCILALIIAILICKLLKKFPNEDIIDISEYIGKKPLKIIVGILFETLFTIIIITTLYQFSNMLQKIYFPTTPITFILLIFLIAIGFSNKVGFKSLIKTNTIVVILTLASLIVILAGTIKNIDLNRLYPILGTDLRTTFIKGSENIFAYSGLLYLFLILPFLKNKNDFKQISILSITISGIYLLFIVITLLSLFPFITQINGIMPMYLLTRNIEFGNFIQRTDAIFIFLWILSIFSYLSISLMFMKNILKKLTMCSNSSTCTYSFLGIFLGLIILFENQAIFQFLERIVYKYLLLALLGICLLILIIGNFKRKEKYSWKKSF